MGKRIGLRDFSVQATDRSRDDGMYCVHRRLSVCLSDFLLGELLAMRSISLGTSDLDRRTLCCPSLARALLTGACCRARSRPLIGVGLGGLLLRAVAR